MSKTLKRFNDLTTLAKRFMHSPDFLAVFIIHGIRFDGKCTFIMITCPCNEHPLTPHFCTVSHFSSAPLIKCKISRYGNEIFILRCFHVCIIHRKNIVIEFKTNDKMDPEEYYPQNSKSHSIVSYWILITLHYFQCRFSALR